MARNEIFLILSVLVSEVMQQTKFRNHCCVRFWNSNQFQRVFQRLFVCPVTEQLSIQSASSWISVFYAVYNVDSKYTAFGCCPKTGKMPRCYKCVGLVYANVHEDYDQASIKSLVLHLHLVLWITTIFEIGGNSWQLRSSLTGFHLR